MVTITETRVTPVTRTQMINTAQVKINGFSGLPWMIFTRIVFFPQILHFTPIMNMNPLEFTEYIFHNLQF